MKKKKKSNRKKKIFFRFQIVRKCRSFSTESFQWVRCRSSSNSAAEQFSSTFERISPIKSLNFWKGNLRTFSSIKAKSTNLISLIALMNRFYLRQSCFLCDDRCRNFAFLTANWRTFFWVDRFSSLSRNFKKHRQTGPMAGFSFDQRNGLRIF